jgi:hypothetical protein
MNVCRVVSPAGTPTIEKVCAISDEKTSLLSRMST